MDREQLYIQIGNVICIVLVGLVIAVLWYSLHDLSPSRKVAASVQNHQQVPSATAPNGELSEDQAAVVAGNF